MDVHRLVCALPFFWGGVGSITVWQVKSIKIIYSKSCRELSIVIYMSRIWRGGGPDVVTVFFGGVSSFFLGHFHKNYKISAESSAQAQLNVTLSKLGKRGGSVDMSKSLRYKRSGAGRGVSQANGAAIHSKLPELCQHEIVSGIRRNGSNVGLCKPVMGAWWFMWAWASASQLLPHNSAAL